MLVRRSVLEQLGFDDRLPVFGNDVDFGWRAARAGHRTLVVPDAVVFHVEAAHRGVRRTPLTGRHSRRGERQAALYTLLVNTSGRWLPFLWLRLLLGSLRAGARLPARARSRARPATSCPPWPGSMPGPDWLLGGSPAAASVRDGRPRATYATCSRRPGCPTGTASTSSPTSPSR